MTSWKNDRVMVGCVRMEVSKELTEKFCGFQCKGEKVPQLSKKQAYEDYISLFLQEGEFLKRYQSGFSTKDFLSPWGSMNYKLIRYFTLEGIFHMVYGYHLSLLNHLRHTISISYPLFLFSSMGKCTTKGFILCCIRIQFILFTTNAWRIHLFLTLPLVITPQLTRVKTLHCHSISKNNYL